MILSAWASKSCPEGLGPLRIDFHSMASEVVNRKDEGTFEALSASKNAPNVPLVPLYSLYVLDSVDINGIHAVEVPAKALHAQFQVQRI